MAKRSKIHVVFIHGDNRVGWWERPGEEGYDHGLIFSHVIERVKKYFFRITLIFITYVEKLIDWDIDNGYF